MTSWLPAEDSGLCCHSHLFLLWPMSLLNLTERHVGDKFCCRSVAELLRLRINICQGEWLSTKSCVDICGANQARKERRLHLGRVVFIIKPDKNDTCKMPTSAWSGTSGITAWNFGTLPRSSFCHHSTPRFHSATFNHQTTK